MPTRLFYTHIDNAAATLARLWDRLPIARQQQLCDRPLAARAEGAALSALLHTALAAWDTNTDGVCTVEVNTLIASYPTWETDAHGKPFAEGIDTPHGRLYPAFSHSHGHVLAVLCDCPCGADIQTWDTAAFSPARWARTAARIAHPDDPPATDGRALTRQFAAKEAVLKRDGCGLRRALSSVKLAEHPIIFDETVPSCIIAVAVSR